MFIMTETGWKNLYKATPGPQPDPDDPAELRKYQSVHEAYESLFKLPDGKDIRDIWDKEKKNK